MRYIYILACADDTLYTGITTDLERRVNEHNSEAVGARYTKIRRPVRLVRSKQVASRAEASSYEYRIKKWSRQQKQALIAGDIIL